MTCESRLASSAASACAACMYLASFEAEYNRSNPVYPCQRGSVQKESNRERGKGGREAKGEEREGGREGGGDVGTEERGKRDGTGDRAMGRARAEGRDGWMEGWREGGRERKSAENLSIEVVLNGYAGAERLV